MIPPPLGLCTNCTIAHVVDGDTVDVVLSRLVRVRLLDCWAPEQRSKDAMEKLRGMESAAHLANLLPVGSQARLYVPGSPTGEVGDLLTLDRVLGRLWIPNHTQDVSALQVQAGHAQEVTP